MSTSKEEIWKNIKAFFGDAGHEALQSVINDEVEATLVDERINEIACATAALYEAKVEEKVIIQLLHDHWKIDKSQATEVLRVEKTVESPMNVLRKYLRSQGYKNIDIIKFMRNNNVRKQLENSLTLWKLSYSPARLMKAVEENNKHIV